MSWRSFEGQMIQIHVEVVNLTIQPKMIEFHVDEMSECPKQDVSEYYKITSTSQLTYTDAINSTFKTCIHLRLSLKNYLSLEPQLPFMSPLGTFFVSL